MSEDNTGVTSASPAQQQTVPKERLDELIADRRRLEEQLNITQQLLRQAVPRQTAQVTEVEPEFLQRLKEQNPEAYQAHKMQEHKLKQQSAAMFTVMDNQDRMQFLQHFGEDGKQNLEKVESELARLRERGIHYDRGQIFVHIMGQEAIKAKSAPKAEVKVPAPKVEVQAEVPSSDPSVAGTTASGSAVATSGRKSIEDWEKELANFKI